MLKVFDHKNCIVQVQIKWRLDVIFSDHSYDVKKPCNNPSKRRLFGSSITDSVIEKKVAGNLFEEWLTVLTGRWATAGRWGPGVGGERAISRNPKIENGGSGNWHIWSHLRLECLSLPALRGPIRPEKPTLPYNHSAFAPVCNFSTLLDLQIVIWQPCLCPKKSLEKGYVG